MREKTCWIMKVVITYQLLEINPQSSGVNMMMMMSGCTLLTYKETN